MFAFIAKVYLLFVVIVGQVVVCDATADTVEQFLMQDLQQIEERLLRDSFFDYITVRERLHAFSYEDLMKINKAITKKESLKTLHKLVEGLKRKKQDVYTFNETFTRDWEPLKKRAPFYPQETYSLRSVSLEAERLYFDNLNLTYIPQKLQAIQDNYFRAPYLNDNGAANYIKKDSTIHSFFLSLAQQKKHAMWKYKVAGEKQYNISHERLPVKKYTENSIMPVIYNGMLLVRNEYRIFACDALTGEQLWSVAPDTNGEENCYTIVHMHHNPYGYEMTREGEMLFTELAGRLCAYKLEAARIPELKWSISLGEYTLATKPVVAFNTVIVGLINARGELWVCGFTQDKGTATWQTYIGLSTFSSSVCTLSLVSNENIIIGTNHGVILSLDGKTGLIRWMRTYQPKKYSVFDWFQKKHFMFKNISQKGFLPFDTQFLQERDGVLIYKPREAETVFFLSRENGALIKKIRMEQDLYYALGMLDAFMVVLSKQTPQDNRLLLVNVTDETVLDSQNIPHGALRGVVYLDQNTIVCKVGESLLQLRRNQTSIVIDQIPCKQGEWLVGAKDGKYAVAQDNTLYFSTEEFNNRDKKNILLRNNLIVSMEAYIREDSQFTKFAALHLVNSTYKRNVMANDLIAPLLMHEKEIRKGKAKHLIAALGEVYGNEIVHYKNTSLRFGLLIQNLTGLENERVSNSVSARQELHELFSLYGSAFMEVLPVHVVKGEKPNLYFFSHNDVIYCVNEQHDILWHRKVAFRKQRNGAREIDIYLYDNIVIINDKLGVIAVNKIDGLFLWSDTYSVFRDTNIFVKNNRGVGYQAAFLNNAILTQRNEYICLRDIFTGVPMYTWNSGLDFANVMRVGNQEIALIGEKKRNPFLVCIDTETKKVREINLKPYSKNPEIIDMVATEEGFVILLDRKIYDYRYGKRKLKTVFELKNAYERNLFRHEATVYIVQPGTHIVALKDDGMVFQKAWEWNEEYEPVRSVLGEKGDSLCAINGGKIIMLRPEEHTYVLYALNLLTGKVVWQQAIPTVKGVYGDFYGIHFTDEYAFMVLYTAPFSWEQLKKHEYEKLEDFAFDLNPYYMKVDIETGVFVEIKEFDRIVNYGYRRGYITSTENYLVYTINGNKLYAQLLQ